MAVSTGNTRTWPHGPTFHFQQKSGNLMKLPILRKASRGKTLHKEASQFPLKMVFLNIYMPFLSQKSPNYA